MRIISYLINAARTLIVEYWIRMIYSHNQTQTKQARFCTDDKLIFIYWNMNNAQFKICMQMLKLL